MSPKKTGGAATAHTRSATKNSWITSNFSVACVGHRAHRGQRRAAAACGFTRTAINMCQPRVR
eukprot:scaffold3740_cov322-Prasinococcus_capsulatus_cf.AAC.7